MINTQSFKLDIKKSTTPRLRLVNGDTANVFVITIQDDGNAVTLNTTLHKIIAVFTRADGQVYTQDADTGVSFTTGGVVTIAVRPASFRTGTNKVCLQVYKREDSSATTYPLLCTTNEAQFPARSQAIPDSGAPNAPSQLPMLEGLIDDARDAIADCEEATRSANTAAGEANDAAYDARVVTAQMTHMLQNIDNEPTQDSDHLVKSGGVYSFVNTSVQEAADDVRAQIPAGATSNPLMDGTAAKGTSSKWAREDHVHPHDTSKQDVLTFDNAPTSGSNNPVKSGGIKTAIDAAEASASKKNVYIVTHDAEWTSDIAQGYTDDYGDDLLSIANHAAFAAQITTLTGETVTLYEYYRDEQNSEFYLKSEPVNGRYITAILNVANLHVYAQIVFSMRDDESPLVLHVTGTEEVEGAGGQTYRTVTFETGDLSKIQALAKTRDMCLHIQSWVSGEADRWYALKKTLVRDDGTNLEVTFTCIIPSGIGDESTGTATGISGMSVKVYYTSGVYHSAVATIWSKTF